MEQISFSIFSIKFRRDQKDFFWKYKISHSVSFSLGPTLNIISLFPFKYYSDLRTTPDNDINNNLRQLMKKVFIYCLNHNGSYELYTESRKVTSVTFVFVGAFLHTDRIGISQQIKLLSRIDCLGSPIYLYI